MKRSEVIQAIVSHLNMRCQCDINITSAGFQCFPSSPNAVTFRARITGSQQTTASEMIRFLEEWTASEATISVQAQLLSSDGNCAVRIASLSEQECRLEEPTMQDSTIAAVSGGIPTVVFIGSIAAAVVIVLVFILAVVVLFMILQKRAMKPVTSQL